MQDKIKESLHFITTLTYSYQDPRFDWKEETTTEKFQPKSSSPAPQKKISPLTQEPKTQKPAISAAASSKKPLRKISLSLFPEEKKLYQKIAPDLSLYEIDPLLENLYLEKSLLFAPVLILLPKMMTKKFHRFLSSLQIALEMHFVKASTIALEDLSIHHENMKEVQYMISIKTTLITSKHREFFKELPVEKKRFLYDKPLLCIDPIETYLQSPEKKKLLWDLLRQFLGSR